MHSRTSLLLTLGFLALATSGASAQERIYLLGAEATNGDDFGRTAADVGDINGDGFPDVVVGAPFDDPSGINSAGSVFAYSGRTGSLIWTRAGQYAGDLFGWSLDGIGDVNGDGHGDIIVGAPGWDNNGVWSGSSGSVYVISGATGGTMTQFSINNLNAQLGYSVCGLGDITGDNLGDYAFSIPYRDTNGLTDNGYVAVYSGAGTTFLFSREGTENGALFGHAMDGVRATGAQATSRWLVGEPRVDGAGVDRGQVRLMDGFGNIVSLFVGSTNNEWFGAAVAGVGDVNNDGTEDYAISSPYTDVLFVGADAGVVRVYSGANTGSVLVSIIGATAGAQMGLDIAGVGDVDGDGYDDVLAGAPFDDTNTTDGGEARLVSGRTGLTLQSWKGGFDDHMGFGVSGAGDLNSDGLADIMIGAKDAPFGAGEVYVYLSGTAPTTIYCNAKVNSQGCAPQLGTSGVASRTIGNQFYVTATNVLNQKFGILFWGDGSNNSPFQGGTLCVQPPLHRTSPQPSGGNLGPDDCSGGYSFHFSHTYMNAEGVMAGDRVYAQYWSRDPAASFQVGLTNAGAFDVAP